MALRDCSVGDGVGDGSGFLQGTIYVMHPVCIKGDSEDRTNNGKGKA